MKITSTLILVAGLSLVSANTFEERASKSTNLLLLKIYLLTLLSSHLFASLVQNRWRFRRRCYSRCELYLFSPVLLLLKSLFRPSAESTWVFHLELSLQQSHPHEGPAPLLKVFSLPLFYPSHHLPRLRLGHKERAQP